MKSQIRYMDDLKDFFENCPPYTKKTLSILLAENMIESLPKLELFCTECKKEKTFIYSESQDESGELSFLYKSSKNTFAESISKEYACRDEQSNFETYYLYDPEVYIEDSDLLLRYICSHCNEKYYYLLQFSAKGLMKLCQYPSFFYLSSSKIEKYKKLSEKHYKDYKQSLLAKSNNLWVASFIYLRRILEDLVESKYELLSPKEEQARFVDKLKAVQEVEDIIPKEIEDIKNVLYSVLSKGVHEYTEEECSEMYDAVNCVIELILDKQLEEKKRAKKISDSKIKIQTKLRSAKSSQLQKTGVNNE